MTCPYCDCRFRSTTQMKLECGDVFRVSIGKSNIVSTVIYSTLIERFINMLDGRSYRRDEVTILSPKLKVSEVILERAD